MKHDVAIIGGGIISLFSAYYLQKEGRSVVIIEKDKIAKGSSEANAGLIVPSHFTPIATLPTIFKGIKWMFNYSSPFCIKPDISTDFLKWTYNFIKSSTPNTVSKNIPILYDLNMSSLNEYKVLSKELDFSLSSSGLLMVFKDEKELKEEESILKQGVSLGLNAKMISKRELIQKEGIEFDVVGASLYEDDSMIKPYEVCITLKEYLLKNGVDILEHCDVLDFSFKGPIIDALTTSKGDILAKEFILANGAHLGNSAKKLNLDIPIRSGKGYSAKIDKDSLNVKTPMILGEAKVAISPYEEFVRVGGSMEICDIDFKKREKRLGSIISSIPSYIPSFKATHINSDDFWVGLRPCSADGLPYIGKVDSYKNLYVNGGHSMMGVSLAPISGRMISENMTKGSIKYKDELNPLRFSN